MYNLRVVQYKLEVVMGLCCTRVKLRSLEISLETEAQHQDAVEEVKIDDQRKIRISHVLGAMGGGIVGGFFNQVFMASVRKEMSYDWSKEIEIMAKTAFLSLSLSYIIAVSSYAILNRN